MNFDGVSFSVDKVSVLDCQYGVQYWREKENKKKRLKLQGTPYTQDRVSCTHQNTHLHTYPEFQISPQQSKGLSQYKLRQIKEDRLQATREAIRTVKSSQ